MRTGPPWSLIFAVLFIPALCPAMAAAGKARPADVTPPTITLAFPAAGQAVDRSAVVVSGTVTDPGGIASIDLTLNAGSAMHLSPDSEGWFQAAVSLREGENSLVLRATDTTGNQAVLTRDISLTTRTGPITIESPLPGARVAASRVTVTGRVDASVSKLYVDGTLAQIDNGRFSLADYPLDQGSNVITATTGTAADHVTVTRVTGDVPGLSASPATGEPGFVATFHVSKGSAASLTGWEFDAEGDGSYVAAPSGVDGLRHQYPRAGIYRPAMRARTTEGTVLSGRTLVTVRSPAVFLSSFPVDDPSAIAVDHQGRLAVLERAPCRLRIFSADGAEIARVGKRGAKNLEFADPLGLAVDEDGNFLVADTGNHRIQKLSPTLSHLASWGKPGTRQAEFNLPSGISIDGDGSSYVVDAGNRRVQVFGPRGVFQRQWPLAGMTEPRGVAVMSGDVVAVSDKSGSVLRRFDSRGTGETWEDGSLQPRAPAGLWHDEDSQLLLVAETAGAVSVIAASGAVVRRIDRLEGDPIGLRTPVMAVRSPSRSGLIYHVADPGAGRVVTAAIEASTGLPPAQVWQNVRWALMGGNIDSVLTWFCPCVREEYRSLFGGISGELPRAAIEMRPLVPLEVGETRAVYGTLRVVDGKEVLFPVEFVLDEGGQWRIESW